jgi:hypothetical protein
MSKYLLFFLVCLCSNLHSQTQIETEAKGTGISRTDALQDALRNAVSQGAGVSIASETKVENFMILSDAIASNTKGYIKSYIIIKEIPFPDRFEVIVKAIVTTESIKADFQLLAKQLGGIRFLVMIDPKESENNLYEPLYLAVDKINQALAKKNCRYIEPSRFNSLKKETVGLMESMSSDKMNYAQQLGLLADAQFIILLSDYKVSQIPGAFDISRGQSHSFTAKIFDNCTGEGLGSITLASNTASKNVQDGLQKAVDNNFESLFSVLTSYVGTWLNNGTPFELRFYQSGTYRDFRDFRKKLKEDNSFGGELEIVSVLNYTKLNCTFKKRADELADKILDIADEIASFKDLKLDVKHIYGRQISLAPQKFVLPSIPVLKDSTAISPNK